MSDNVEEEPDHQRQQVHSGRNSKKKGKKMKKEIRKVLESATAVVQLLAHLCEHIGLTRWLERRWCMDVCKHTHTFQSFLPWKDRGER